MNFHLMRGRVDSGSFSFEKKRIIPCFGKSSPHSVGLPSFRAGRSSPYPILWTFATASQRHASDHQDFNVVETKV